jgi:hypothetical protein
LATWSGGTIIKDLWWNWKNALLSRWFAEGKTVPLEAHQCITLALQLCPKATLKTKNHQKLIDESINQIYGNQSTSPCSFEGSY